MKKTVAIEVLNGSELPRLCVKYGVDGGTLMRMRWVRGRAGVISASVAFYLSSRAKAEVDARDRKIKKVLWLSLAASIALSVSLVIWILNFDIGAHFMLQLFFIGLPFILAMAILFTPRERYVRAFAKWNGAVGVANLHPNFHAGNAQR